MTTRELLREELKKVWGDRKSMVDYCDKKATQIVQTSKGYLITIERQEIEKDFCFGYGYCGSSTQEEYNSAVDMAEYARTNEAYFIRENLKPINEQIEFYKNNKLFITPQYYTQTKNCLLRGVKSEDYKNTYGHGMEWEELTAEDKEALIQACEAEKASFTKRLNTYLKRYGLSKVRSWSYLID